MAAHVTNPAHHPAAAADPCDRRRRLRRQVSLAASDRRARRGGGRAPGRTPDGLGRRGADEVDADGAVKRPGRLAAAKQLAYGLTALVAVVARELVDVH